MQVQWFMYLVSLPVSQSACYCPLVVTNQNFFNVKHLSMITLFKSHYRYSLTLIYLSSGKSYCNAFNSEKNVMSLTNNLMFLPSNDA